MQIRLGNRQDEDSIRSLCEKVLSEFGLNYDLDGAESDLKNIESNYFGVDGLFIVAEESMQIVGFAAARRTEDTIIELVRFAVDPEYRGKGTGRRLLNTVLQFASDLDYDRMIVEPARQYPGGEKALMKMGFTSDSVEDAQTVWYRDLESRH